MSKVTYPSSSPYALTPQSNWAIGLYKHRSIPESVDDVPYKVEQKYHNRPDLLAAELYGDAQYYWVFMIRNMNLMRDPLWDFVAGLEIYIPSRERLKALGI